MAETTELRTYRPGDTITLEIVAEDESGVGHIEANYMHKDHDKVYVKFRGDGEGQKQVRLSLQHEVTEDTVPGEYICEWLYLSDVHGRYRFIRDRQDLRFIIVNEQGGDYEPPELRDARLS